VCAINNRQQYYRGRRGLGKPVFLHNRRNAESQVKAPEGIVPVRQAEFNAIQQVQKEKPGMCRAFLDE
jgi:hypothetical protein